MILSLKRLAKKNTGCHLLGKPCAQCYSKPFTWINSVNEPVNPVRQIQLSSFYVEGNQGSTGASLVDQMVKNVPAMQETQVQSLGQEDLLEEEMAT